jgi:hypothetical protein
LQLRKIFKDLKMLQKGQQSNCNKKGNAYLKKGGKSLRRRKIVFDVNEFSENIVNLTIKINIEIRFLFPGMNAGEPELRHPHLRQPR